MLSQVATSSSPPQKKNAGPLKLSPGPDEPQSGAIVLIKGSRAAVEVARPPCECPVAPTLAVSTWPKYGLASSAFCSSSHCTPTTMGGGSPCATLGLFEPITMKPCEA